MADSTSPAASPETPAKPRKRWLRLVIILLALVLLGAGGFAGFVFYQRGAAAGRAEAEKQRKQHRHEGEEGGAGEQAEGQDKASEDGGQAVEANDKLEFALPEDAEVKRVTELQPFIVNLSDQDAPRYLRMTVSLGLGGEAEGSEAPNPIFVTRVRNAMLAVMTTKSSNELLTAEGKATLRKQLLRAARAASEEPRVEAIYITDFIIQL